MTSMKYFSWSLSCKMLGYHRIYVKSVQSQWCTSKKNPNSARYKPLKLCKMDGKDKDLSTRSIECKILWLKIIVDWWLPCGPIRVRFHTSLTEPLCAIKSNDLHMLRDALQCCGNHILLVDVVLVINVDKSIIWTLDSSKSQCHCSHIPSR